MEILYLEVYKPGFNIVLPLESVIILFILKYLNAFWMDLVLVETSIKGSGFNVPETALSAFNYRFVKIFDVHKQVLNCVFPVMVKKVDRFYLAGLCAVLRNIIKETSKLHSSAICERLLGFRSGCLMACAEVSVWTKFCEVDILHTTESFGKDAADLKTIPKDLLRLESHLRQPVRIHNKGKYQQELAKRKNKPIPTNHDNHFNALDQMQSGVLKIDESVGECDYENGAMKNLSQKFRSDCSISVNRQKAHQRIGSKATTSRKISLPQLHHHFSEGVDRTLADMILFPCIHILLVILSKCNKDLQQYLPLVLDWYRRMHQDVNIGRVANELKFPFTTNLLSMMGEVLKTMPNYDLIVPEVVCESLYIRDPKRTSLHSKNYVRQEEIENIISHLKLSGIEVNYEKHPCSSVRLDWSALPEVVHPSFGELPSSRVLRKCQQVENLVSAVLNIARHGDIIVDFCSGGGHLGIVLAYLLPHCQIIMIDNKEESLSRALHRVLILGLNNAILYQTNLDYFKGDFTIGTSLHACGVATDLVLQLCKKHNADVISCPCCYGAVKNTHLLSYPKSSIFQDCGISYKDYCVLGHAADQTHLNDPKTEQGQLCMGYIDTDRLGHLADHGYKTRLCTLDPPSCTPKNNLLIALHQETERNTLSNQRRIACGRSYF